MQAGIAKDNAEWEIIAPPEIRDAHGISRAHRRERPREGRQLLTQLTFPGKAAPCSLRCSFRQLRLVSSLRAIRSRLVSPGFCESFGTAAAVNFSHSLAVSSHGEARRIISGTPAYTRTVRRVVELLDQLHSCRRRA